MERTVETYEFLKGYYDGEITHKDFDIVEMTGEEEEAISKAGVRQNGGKIVRVILERCITRIGTLNRAEVGSSKWLDIIQSLAVGDQDFALLKIREITLGSEIEVAHSCPACKQELKSIVDIDELETKPYNGNAEMLFELPKGHIDKEGTKHTMGILRYPNGLDRELLDSVARNNIGVANTMLLTRCIEELGTLKAYDQVIRKLSLKDRDYLLSILKENQFGLDLDLEMTCAHCGEMFRGNLNSSNFI